MIKDNTIQLRPWEEGDLSALTTLRNDVLLQALLLSRARGSRSEHVLEWLQRRSAHNDQMLFVIADCQKNDPLGYMQVDNINLIDRHARLGVCLLKQYRGQGIGSKAITLISDYLRDIWAIRKLYLKVRSDNVAAIRCYEKNGFKKCGCLHQHIFIEGRWFDVVLMERFLGKKDSSEK